jgi:hypothetical protein
MAYTVGIKRKFWFGFRLVKVKGHDWQHGRFILNCDDGSQEHIPGFSTPLLKVYADFWTHLAQLDRERPAAPPPPRPEPIRQELPRQGATTAPQPAYSDVPEVHEELDPLEQEVKRRATERVQRILAGAN